MDIIEFLKAVFLGIVEGITEWLPISSTGHMILVDEFIKLNVTPEFKEFFLVVIQLGAILAATVVAVIAVQSRMLISFRFMFSSSFLMVFCSLMINLFYLQRQKKYMENQAFPMYFPAQLLYNIFIFQTQICNLRILSLPSYTLRTE